MLCLIAGAVTVALATSGFTLSWTHSVERTEIHEDYQLADGRLVLMAARIKGSGAGFDPPVGAELAEGWWRYEPRRTLDGLTLARSDSVTEWQLCVDNRCRALTEYLPEIGGSTAVRLAACPAAP